MSANDVVIATAEEINYYFRNYSYADMLSDLPILSLGLATDLDRLVYSNAVGTKYKLMLDASTTANLTDDRVMITSNSGKADVSGITGTELLTLHGIDSNIQDQLDANAKLWQTDGTTLSPLGGESEISLPTFKLSSSTAEVTIKSFPIAGGTITAEGLQLGVTSTTGVFGAVDGTNEYAGFAMISGGSGSPYYIKSISAVGFQHNFDGDINALTGNLAVGTPDSRWATADQKISLGSDFSFVANSTQTEYYKGCYDDGVSIKGIGGLVPTIFKELGGTTVWDYYSPVTDGAPIGTAANTLNISGVTGVISWTGHINLPTGKAFRVNNVDIASKWSVGTYATYSPEKNVSIGEDGKNWQSVYRSLDVGSFGLAGNATSDVGFLAQNVYRDPANFKYKTNGYGYAFYFTSGTIRYYGAPSGIAGAASTLSEIARMTEATGDFYNGRNADLSITNAANILYGAGGAKLGGALYIKEQAAASTGDAAYGQIWAKTDGHLHYQKDAATDYLLSAWEPATSGINYSGGNVGIDTNNPLSKLVVSDDSGTGLEIAPNTTVSTVSMLSYNRTDSEYSIMDFRGTEFKFFTDDGTGIDNTVSIGTDGSVTMTEVYSDTLGSTNKPLGIDSTGKLAPIGSTNTSWVQLGTSGVYYRRINGIVYMRGLNSGGTNVGGNLLPVGFRPYTRLSFNVLNSSGVASNVVITGNNGAISDTVPATEFEVISFVVEA